MYVIRRDKDDMFVSKPYSKKSYTNDILNAKIFNTMSEALYEKCDNEYIENVLDILKRDR